MKKKLLALIAALTLSLTACGGKDIPAQDGAPPETSAPENGETAVPSPGVPEENGPHEPGAPAENESQEAIDLTEFYNTLRQEHTWPELMSLTEDETLTELLDSYYPGLSEISTRQCGVYIAAISAAVGEIALVEVENAEDVPKVEDIFQARIDYQVGNGTNPGGAWYPETIEGWKTSSRIVSGGNYVMLAVGDGAAAAADRFAQLFQ